MLDQAGVQRQPSIVRRLDPVGDHQVRVQLRVKRPAGVLAERCGDDACCIHHSDFTADAIAGVSVVFDPLRHGLHGRVVSVEHSAAHLVIAECEQQGHGLRRRSCDIEATHRRVVVPAAEVSIRSRRIHARHHGQEVLVIHLVAKAEHPRAFAVPQTAGLSGLQVVVRQLLHVVGASVRSLQGGHPHGHDTPPLTRAAVHSSIGDVSTGSVVGSSFMAAYAGN